MDQEALEILQMVKDRKITPEQGADLLAALKAGPAPGTALASGKPLFVRVRVKAEHPGNNVDVNANLPIALADLALKIAQNAKITQDGQTIVLGEYLKDLGGMDMSAILQLVQEGAEGKLVDVAVGGEDGKPRVKVEVSVD